MSLLQEPKPLPLGKTRVAFGADKDEGHDRRVLARGEHTFSCSFSVSLGGKHPRVGRGQAPD